MQFVHPRLRPSPQFAMKISTARQILTSSVAALLAASGIARADLSWDTILNNGTIDGGAGYWNPTFPNWTATGLLNVPWDSTGAIFGGTAGLVSINASISTTGLTFNTAGYVIVGDPFDGNATDDTLTLTGGATIVANASATIRTIVAGAAGLNLSGAGTLTLTNTANSFTGNIGVNGATLSIVGQGTADATILGSGTKTVNLSNGGMLRVTSGNFDPNAGKNLAVVAGGTNLGVFRQDAGTATFDASGQLASASGTTLSMTGAELLRLLVNHRGQTLSREKILAQVWKETPHITPRTVDVHIAWLRQKLEDQPDAPRHIATARGEGYRFEK